MSIGKLRQEIRTLRQVLSNAWKDLHDPMGFVEKNPDAADAKVIYFFNSWVLEKGKLEGRLDALSQLLEASGVDPKVEAMLMQLSNEIRRFMDRVWENSDVARNLMADAQNNAQRRLEKFRRELR